MKTGNDYVLSIIDDLRTKFHAAHEKWLDYSTEAEKLRDTMAVTQGTDEKTKLWLDIDALNKLKTEALKEVNAYRNILNKLKDI